jgi:hypothetical protein
VKDIVYKTNWHALEEPGNICCEMSTIWGEELQRITFSAVVLSAFGQEVDIFTFCCGSVEFLLDIQKVITRANLFLVSFADC